MVLTLEEILELVEAGNVEVLKKIKLKNLKLLIYDSQCYFEQIAIANNDLDMLKFLMSVRHTFRNRFVSLKVLLKGHDSLNDMTGDNDAITRHGGLEKLIYEASYPWIDEKVRAYLETYSKHISNRVLPTY